MIYFFFALLVIIYTQHFFILIKKYQRIYISFCDHTYYKIIIFIRKYINSLITMFIGIKNDLKTIDLSFNHE